MDDLRVDAVGITWHADGTAAIEDMVSQGVDGILIAPTDPEALLPAIESARAAGVPWRS